MIPRRTLIAVLIGIEVAIVAAMFGAIRGGPAALWHGFGTAAVAGPAAAPAWTFPAGSAPAVSIDIGHADLTIETRPGAQIAVAVEPGMEVSSSGPISARDDAGTIRITARDRNSDASAYIDERNVHVTVPPETRVTVERAGNITAGGLRAPGSFDSPNGHIDITDFHGELTATADNGHVEISDSDCPALHASSSNGRIVLHRVNARRLDASSSNGRVEATALAVRDGSISTSNGRVSLGFAPGADTTVSAVASNGGIRVHGLTQTATGAPPAWSDDDSDSATRTVRVGAGNGRLDVHAGNGSIDLKGES